MKTAKNWIWARGICVLLGMALLLLGCDTEVSEEKEDLSTPETEETAREGSLEEFFPTALSDVTKVQIHYCHSNENREELGGEPLKEFLETLSSSITVTDPTPAESYHYLYYECTFSFDDRTQDPLTFGFVGKGDKAYLYSGFTKNGWEEHYETKYTLDGLTEESMVALFRPYFDALEGWTFLPVEKTIDFSTIDFSNTSHIELFRGWDAQTIVVEDEAEIETILSAIQKVSGTDPISVRGYYGTSYVCKIYQEGEETPTRIGFWSSSGTKTEFGSFDYGLYEQVINHQYSAMYTMTGISDKELFAILDPFFDTK